MDGTYHRVLRAKTFLRRKVVPGDLPTLYNGIVKQLDPATTGFIAALSGDTEVAKK